MKKIISIILMLTLLVSTMAIPSFAATSTLHKGSTGSDVIWHQKTMNFLGFNCGTADGIYGNKTISATKAFQKEYNLTVDGIAGSRTVTKGKTIVKDIQNKLNSLGYGKISVDGLPGNNTVTALKKFQRDMGLTQTGVCDATTYQCLNNKLTNSSSTICNSVKAFEKMCLESWTLPIKDSFKSITGSRKFASSRDSGRRAHAGIDFVANAGTKVYAITSGKVLQVYTFYEGTKAVEVLNDDGSILRYCEIAPSVKSGDRISQGDIIGTIMRATGGTSMLHLELYRGDASGSLTQRNNKEYTYVDNDCNFQRRSDLMDPTFLKDLKPLK